MMINLEIRDDELFYEIGMSTPFTGIAKYTLEKGDVYEGEFLEGNYHGKGTLSFADGRIYTGDFKEDSFNGTGTLIWSNGDKYEGTFVDDMMDGKGTFTWFIGDIYVGDLDNVIGDDD